MTAQHTRAIFNNFLKQNNYEKIVVQFQWYTAQSICDLKIKKNYEMKDQNEFFKLVEHGQICH